MDTIVDFILLAASAGASIYCLVLSRRLEMLKNTDAGLGASIAAMSQSLEQTRTVLHEARENAQASLAALSPLVDEARLAVASLEELIDTSSALAEEAEHDIAKARDLALRRIHRALGPLGGSARNVA